MSSASSTRGLHAASILLAGLALLLMAQGAWLLMAQGAWAANPSAARGRINAAEIELERGDKDEAAAKLKEAEKFLEDATPEERAPFEAKLKELHDKLGGGNSDQDNAKLVRQAQGLVTQAKAAMHPEEGVGKLDEAEKLLQPVPAAAKAGVLADIKATRDSLAAAKPGAAAAAPAATGGDDNDRIVRAARQKIDLAKGEDPRAAEPYLKQAEDMLAPVPDAKKTDVLAEIKAVRDKLAGGGDQDNSRLVRQAQGLVTQAKAAMAPAEATDKLNEAEKLLQPVPAAAKADVLADIKATRDKLAAGSGNAASGPAKAAASPADEENDRLVREARRKIAQAKDERDPEPWLKQAEAQVAPVPDAKKADVLAEIKAFRDKLAAGDKDKEYDKIVRDAHMKVEQGKGMGPSSRESYYADAEKMLQPVPDAKKAPVLAEIKAARDELAAGQASGNIRAVQGEIESRLNLVEQELKGSPDRASDDLGRASAMLDADKAKILTPETRQALQTRIVGLQGQLTGNSKKAALDSADPQLKKLEERLASDPYHDIEPSRAYGMRQDIDAFVIAAHRALDRQPKDDADIRARNDKLAALEGKLDGYAAAWNRDQDIKQLAASFKFDTQNAVGWEQETLPAANGPGIKPWRLGKAVAAIRASVYWLNRQETKEKLDKYKDDPAAQAVRTEAEKTRDAAAAKLDAAFNAALADAEARPMPTRGFDLSVPSEMAREAKDDFAGTKYLDPDVARAAKLDQKWQENLAAIEKEAAAALKQMTADADAAWPKIAGAITVADGFKPADAAAFKGKTVRFKAVRNRSGWDFDGKYDIAIWIGSAPIAGSYDPKVAKAMQDAVRTIRMDINDHIDWDVIAVVEGPGKINQRIFTHLIDDKTRDEVAKIESYTPIDCVLIRVIAMRAGPVAVGPQ